MIKETIALILSAGLLAGQAQAQDTTVQTGSLREDTSLPVEVQSDQLAVNQTDRTAVFTGNVRVKQGQTHITAAEARLEYTEEGTEIERVFFYGRVLVTRGKEAAEGDEGVYTLANGEIVLTGNVLLTQGKSTISGQKLNVDLDTGTGVMEGGVQTVFVPGKKKNP